MAALVCKTCSQTIADGTAYVKNSLGQFFHAQDLSLDPSDPKYAGCYVASRDK